MNKKILIGSIITVAILIGISFTSVVGYQSTPKTIAEASPLFTVRSSRALDVDSKDLSFNYVGKGEEINIPLTEREEKKELILEALGIVSKMNEKNLRKLIALAINNARKNYPIKEEDINKIIEGVYLLKDDKGEIRYFDANRKPMFCPVSHYTSDPHMGFICLIFNIIWFIGDIFWSIIYFLRYPFSYFYYTLCRFCLVAPQ